MQKIFHTESESKVSSKTFILCLLVYVLCYFVRILGHPWTALFQCRFQDLLHMGFDVNHIIIMKSNASLSWQEIHGNHTT